MENNTPTPEEEDSNIIVLTDENGEELSFEFLDLVEYQDRKYVVLLPADNSEEAQVVILELEEGDGDEDDTFLSVEDTEVLDGVYDIFKERFKDIFTFDS